MQPSQFAAIRPSLEEAVCDIDNLLTRLRRNEDAERQAEEFFEAFTDGRRGDDLPEWEPPARAWGHPWSQSAMTAAERLQKVGLTVEAAAIAVEIAKLPRLLSTDPESPDYPPKQTIIAQKAAERVREILAACLAPPGALVAHASASIGDIAVHNRVNFAPQVVVKFDGTMPSPNAPTPVANQGTSNAGLTPPAAEAEQGEGKGGTSSIFQTAKKRKRGRKKLSKDEAKRRNDILSQWEQARNSGTAMKTFCQQHEPSLTSKELEKIVAWKATRERRKRGV